MRWASRMDSDWKFDGPYVYTSSCGNYELKKSATGEWIVICKGVRVCGVRTRDLAKQEAERHDEWVKALERLDQALEAYFMQRSGRRRGTAAERTLGHPTV